MSAALSLDPRVYEDKCCICIDENDKYRTAIINGRWSFVSGTDANSQLIVDNDKASRFILKNCCHAIHKECFDSKKIKECPTCKDNWKPVERDLEANSIIASPEERQQNEENIFHMIFCMFLVTGVVIMVMIVVFRRVDNTSTSP